jgi:RNA polymerase I-specific transcription initiation factor RRN3
MTSLNPNLTDVFLGFLMKRLYHVFDQPGDGKKKSAASSASLLTVVNASYIGSFVARAKFLPHRLVRLSFDMLLTWCLRFLGDLPNHLRSGVKALRNSNEVVSEKIAVFYAVSQAVMYIFCFRHRLLIQEHEDSDLTTIKANYRNFLLPIMQSSLNPLKWCMSAVVEEFIRLADMYDLIDCHQIMVKSSRRSAPPVSSANSLHSISMFDDESQAFPVSEQTGSFLGDLDSYFPFDPIILKTCSTYFTEDLYIEWNNLADSSDEAESEEELSSDIDNIGCNRDLLLCNPVWQGLAVRK